ncbi:polysaccharide biosynthesis C-terminal domain-containing protein [Crocinitomicaceae bacterium]|nr:polysaccharide biosynthesis C-terminal domain-containing protein [Crocinitomicaceae bacterium]MDC0099189.1 polysaccharide biosynthesis C-terminal domain-containing protein [Crocinitomicaceae bacterium]MDC1196245.1 polysaccharide biosynthesis C-terminal domain-containing protein [Crocinitomicaceae bacterium]MDC1385269.1 polysaccharide biosynthesis C-terminal domain-containing protein [Crocinitomicaceae bacterium]|tara:strand:+ start:12150 stop:13649 length:1500 start_codon:yes stop_codon:yes gene_type:complete
MGIVQKEGFRTMVISYTGMILGYLNKVILFLLILNTPQIGLVSLLVSLGALFAQFSGLGTRFTIWRFFPFFKNNENNHGGFLPLMLMAVTSGAILFTLLSLLLRETVEDSFASQSKMFLDYYFWFIPIGIASLFYVTLEVYLRSFYKTIVSVFAWDIVLRVLTTVLLLLMWIGQIDFYFFVVAYSLSYTVPVLILFFYLFKMRELNLAPKTIVVKRKFRRILVQFSAFNYVNSLGTTLVNSLDVLMIAQYCGLGPTGVYATTIFLISALQIPYKSILRISSPLVADYWKHRELDKMKELYRKVSSVGLVTGIGSFAFVWLNIDLIFSFLRPEFADGKWVFFFLMIGRVTDMIGGLNGSIFSTSKKYKYDVLFTALMVITVFVLNLLLIPLWGISGAAISTGVAMVCYNLGRLLFVWFVYKIHPFQLNQIFVLSLGVLTMILGALVGDVFVNQWVQMSFDCAIFAVLFVAPIYFLRLEPETINYVHNGVKMLKKRLGKAE